MDNGHPPDAKRQRGYPTAWERETQPTGQPALQERDPHREHIHRQLPTLSAIHSKPNTPTGPGNPFGHPVHHPPQDNPSRRPSDQIPYDSDSSRRPSSGPHQYHPAVQNSHHGPPPFAGRETMVKRDPSDEPQTVHYRQSPTGPHNPEQQHVLTSAHHDRAPHGYDSGGRSPRSAGPYRQPPYNSHGPPQSPMVLQDSFHSPGYPIHGGATAQPSYNSVQYAGSAIAAPKRKAQRASQACDSCRTLKAKCDEGRPTCQSCKEKNQICNYRDPPPKQQDKAQSDMIDSQREIETLLKKLIKDQAQSTMETNNLVEKKMDVMQREIKSLRTQIIQLQNPDQAMQVDSPIQSHFKTSREGASFSPKVENILSSDPHGMHASFDRVLNTIQPSPDDESHASSGQQQILPPKAEGSRGDETEEEEQGEPITVNDTPSLPINHTTGAARLLLVGPIKALASDIMASSRIKSGEKYPMMQEQKRGLLRLYGRGEGLDRPPGYDREPMADYGSEGTPSDTMTDTPSPPGEEWGQLGGLTPPADDSTPLIPHVTPQGITINSEGMPDLTRETVTKWVKSYKTHVNILHPILVPKTLDKLVEVFLKSIPESQAKPKAISIISNKTNPGYGHAPHVGSSSVNAGFTGSPALKRKRPQQSPTQDAADLPNTTEFKPGHPFRSISTAIVLLVMALGAISDHKGKLPDVVPDGPADDQYTSSPMLQNGQPPSPLQNSPLVATPTVNYPSPSDGERGHQSRSRRSSLDGPVASSRRHRPKNIDRIPGLSYFALASDIIGNQLGGNSLQHVHVNILAGLYHGQLGRVLESQAYIYHACRSLQAILQPKLGRLWKLREKENTGARHVVSSRDNPIVIAFWTCLQLESDILAELACTHSGILNLEGTMPHPNLDMAVNDGIEWRVMKHYSEQLFLRKHLNQIHSTFYKPPTVGQNDQPAASAAKIDFDSIESMELARQLFIDWEEGGPPPMNLLDARKRAKLYGARVITYRTFVLQILEHSAAKNTKFRGEIISEKFMSHISAPNVNPNATCLADLDPKVREYATKCLGALVDSTSAFHGLGDPGKDRIIVTNIWGTSHAQFGNMLTLMAAHNDPILTGIVPVERVKDLLEKTLRFLTFNASPSSALYTDFLILRDIGRKTNLLADHWQRNLNSSFSSGGSTDIIASGH